MRAMATHRSLIKCVMESRRALPPVQFLVLHSNFFALDALARRGCARAALYDAHRLECRLWDAHRREITAQNYHSFPMGALQRVHAHVRDVP